MFHMKHNLEQGAGPEILESGGIPYMMDADIQGMSNYGDTFAEALERFLNYLPDFGLGPVHFTESRMARFQSEAATLPELVLKAREAVAALAAEFGLYVARVSVDGHRPIDGGHRSWGTVELAQYAETDDPVQIVDGPYVTWDPVNHHWRIDVSFIDA
jgi:hypothetical protein